MREEGYAYRARSRVPVARGELAMRRRARNEGNYERFRSARRNRLLASAASTRLLSSIPSAALGSSVFRDRDGGPSSSLESLFCI